MTFTFWGFKPTEQGNVFTAICVLDFANSVVISRCFSHDS